MNIIDMSFEQHLELLKQYRYSGYYMSVIEKVMFNSPDIQLFFTINEMVLNKYCTKNPIIYFEEFNKDMDHVHSMLDYYYAPFEPDPVFPYITNTHVQIYMYLHYKRIMDEADDSVSEDEYIRIVYKTRYLKDLLEEHETLTILYILLAINYYLNNAEEKTVAEMTDDESLYFVELHIEDSDRYDDIIDALIKTNTNNPYLQQEKES